MKHIGLFPLSIVLFPGSSYPLHIYESRYKSLIRECIDDGLEFGICLTESGHLFSVGCTARVTAVFRTYEDGRMDIVVTGVERYRIMGLDHDAQPYTVAEIETFQDDDPLPDEDVLGETIGLYNELVEVVYGDAEERLDPSDWAEGGGSFRIAQKSGLDLVLRQQLLEMLSETERLRFLLSYLTDLVPRIRSFEHMQAVIRNDGYVK